MAAGFIFNYAVSEGFSRLIPIAVTWAVNCMNGTWASLVIYKTGDGGGGFKDSGIYLRCFFYQRDPFFFLNVRLLIQQNANEEG